MYVYPLTADHSFASIMKRTLFSTTIIHVVFPSGGKIESDGGCSDTAAEDSLHQ